VTSHEDSETAVFQWLINLSFMYVEHPAWREQLDKNVAELGNIA
jgi:hypothetical protein